MRPLLPLRKPEQSQELWGKDVVDVWNKVVQDVEITKEAITEKRVVAARKQLGFDPKPKIETPPETDLDTRWNKLEAVLRHEREFWPVDRRRELSVNIAALLAEWNGGGEKRQPEFDDAPANPPAATKPEPEPEMNPDASGEKPRVVAGPIPEKQRAPAEANHAPETVTPGDDQEKSMAQIKKTEAPVRTVAVVLHDVARHLEDISCKCESQQENMPRKTYKVRVANLSVHATPRLASPPTLPTW